MMKENQEVKITQNLRWLSTRLVCIVFKDMKSPSRVQIKFLRGGDDKQMGYDLQIKR